MKLPLVSRHILRHKLHVQYMYMCRSAKGAVRARAVLWSFTVCVTTVSLARRPRALLELEPCALERRSLCSHRVQLEQKKKSRRSGQCKGFKLGRGTRISTRPWNVLDSFSSLHWRRPDPWLQLLPPDVTSEILQFQLNCLGNRATRRLPILPQSPSIVLREVRYATTCSAVPSTAYQWFVLLFSILHV